MAPPYTPNDGIYLLPGLPYFWESPDILVNGAGQAFVGSNQVEVNIHRDLTKNVPGRVSVQMFVCNPAVAVVPPGAGTPGASVKIPTYQVANPATYIEPGNIITAAGLPRTFNWDIPIGTPSTAPNGPGHRCLVARCYQTEQNDSLPLTTFDIQTAKGVGDPHSVQKNIEIALAEPFRMSVEFQAANFNTNEKRTIVVGTVFDARPDPRSLQVLIPMLQNSPGFVRIAPRPPRGFGTSAPSIPGVVIRDGTKGGCLNAIFWGLLGIGSAPTFEMDVPLAPGQAVNCALEADLSGSASGDAYIFRLTQRESGSQLLQGGLTVVIVRQ